MILNLGTQDRERQERTSELIVKYHKIFVLYTNSSGKISEDNHFCRKN